MAFPKLLQKLFQNGGGGSKLNTSIMPYNYTRSVNGATPDSNGNVTITTVKTVNNTSPDSNGNVTLNTFITKTGDRGSLAGYETLNSTANAITINATSADDQICTGAVTITVSDGSNGQTWQKNVTITNAGATISPGSKWKWSGGKAPELKVNSLLVCKWAGVFGVLSLVTTE